MCDFKDEYESTLNYLNELETFGWQPGLQRIERLLFKLENPERKFKTIHVGGTNGKGSVTVALAQILKDNGYKTGQFISPEFFSYRERIQVNGEYIKKKSLVEIVKVIKNKINEMLEEGYEHPTSFELCTALAFKYFEEEGSDIAIIEVGLGGSIDSTNVIVPEISILTNVSMDHKEYLGNNEIEIAEVKSGIIKRGKPVVTGCVEPSILRVIESKAAVKGSKIYSLKNHFDIDEITFKNGMTAFRYFEKGYEDTFEFSLLGNHQGRNCSLVIKSILILNELGYNIDVNVLKKSLKKVFWPGRLETLEFKNRTLLLDAAHNVDGAKNLCNSLENIYKYKRLIFVLGILGDKQRIEMVDYFGEIGEIFIVTKPLSPRAKKFYELEDFLEPYSNDISLEEDISKAIALAVKKANKEDLICVTGSIYMIREARKKILGEVYEKY